MTTRKDLVERRRHNRAKIKGEAFVEFYKPRLFKLGKPRIVFSAAIIDISGGGLAFEYNGRHMLFPDFYQLSISTTADKIKIGEVPFKVASDFSISRLSNSKFIRRCGVQFGELTPNKKFQLDAFIKNHTIVDTRSGIERRQFSYSNHSPELRSGKDRREAIALKDT